MDSRTLDLNLLVTLDALLAESNVTRAAARLRLSQPAVSAQLRRLRVLFGDRLLVPAQHGMIPTERALVLKEPLRQAIDGMRAILAQHEAFDPAASDLTMTIAASDYIQYVVLMPLMLALKREAPRIRLAWRSLDARIIADQTERGDIDLVIMTPDTAPDHLRSRKLFDERYVCIARRGHPQLRPPLDLDTFTTLEHVIVSPRGGGFTGPTDAALEALDRSRRVTISVPSFLMVPEIVSRSDMIALVPQRLVRNRTDSFTVCDPPVAVAGFTISLLWHERNTAHPAQRWIRDRIAASLESSHG